MNELSFIVLNRGLITSKYYIEINRMSDISVIVYEWKDLILALRAWLDRDTHREIRYRDEERDINRKRYRKMNISKTYR